MVMAEQSQVWVGSEDSVIYIINIHSMSCNKQLTDHRSSVTGLAVQDGVQATRCGGLHWVGGRLARGWVRVPEGRVPVAGQGERSRSGRRARGRPCMALVMRTEKWSEDVVREDPLQGEHGGHAAGPWPPCPFPGSGLGLPSLACGRITEVPVFAWDPRVPLSSCALIRTLFSTGLGSTLLASLHFSEDAAVN